MARQWMRESVIKDLTVTTGATGSSGAIVDTAGYESVLFLGYIETTAATDRLKHEEGTASDAMAETTGEASGVAPNLYLEVFRPKRYVRGIISASAGAKNSFVMTILKGSRIAPTSNATTVNGKYLYSPVTGTASA